MKNLLLFGLPFSGKTTAGRILGEISGLEFIDTDEELEKQHGCSCRKLFRDSGEQGFRLLERQLLESLRGKDHCVIALGGGTVAYPENEKAARELGPLIYLKCDLAELKKRLGNERPAYLGSSDFETLVKKRAVMYELIADFVIETSALSPKQAADYIGETVGKQFLGTTL